MRANTDKRRLLSVGSWGSAGAVLLAAITCVVGCLAAPSYRGPVSDHFDGKRFYNLGPFEERGFGDLLKWKLSGPLAARWPAFVALPPSPPPPARVDRGIRVTFINHATTLIQLGGVNILTDPVWSERVGPTAQLGPRRHKPPGVRFAELPQIDVVLISHNHYDHLDLPTLVLLQKRDAPLVLAGLGTAKLLQKHGISRAVDLDWWQEQEVQGVRILFTPAQHGSTRSFTDRNVNLWGSYYLRSSQGSVYFAGDTGAGPHFQLIRERLGAPDLALLPIGAYLPRWFMRSRHIDPNEAVAAHRTLGATRSIAIHTGTFQQTDEGIDDPVIALAAALSQQGVPAQDFIVLENGESTMFSRAN
jgi:L-ascorbate metabolism protein UlaG (beta-lactamase superfamily)